MGFRFKQFEINQENAPFKIGTDGLLLGAWAFHEQPQHILDIGTGTGLIALMMAQRFQNATINAVELNPDATKIAGNNFKNSPWRHRILLHSQDFKQYTIENKFDLIVSNPPFFSGSKLSDDTGKNLARHTVEMSLSDLIEKSSLLLYPLGILALVLPFELKNEVIEIASRVGLYSIRICTVFSTPNSNPKRILIEFSNSKSVFEETELIIEEFGRHQYSEEYNKLIKEFLLDK